MKTIFVEISHLTVPDHSIISSLTTERNPLGRPRPVLAADPPGRPQQLEAPVARVPGHGARPDAVARVELDRAVRGGAGEAATAARG